MRAILATRNRHKAEEIQAILGVDCLSLDDLPRAPRLVEEADTFAGNAGGKALQVARWLVGPAGPFGEYLQYLAPDPAGPSPVGRLLVLADDSGLEVDALNGAPGVHSARFAALETGASGNSSDRENNARLLRLLQNVLLAQRTARFRCVLALVQIQPTGSFGEPLLFEGACEGRIQFAPRGQSGFGYDPLFVPDGFSQTFAELGEAVKNRLSHRARALAALREWLGCARPPG